MGSVKVAGAQWQEGGIWSKRETQGPLRERVRIPFEASCCLFSIRQETCTKVTENRVFWAQRRKNCGFCESGNFP